MSKNFIQSAVLRSAAIRAYRTYASVQVWRKGPRIFLNSLPKAGTHLLMSIFDSTPAVMNSRLHLRNKALAVPEVGPATQFDSAGFQRMLSGIRGRQVVTGHLPFISEAEDILDSLEFRTVFLVRNPKDLLVSRLHYIIGLKRHPLHRWLGTNYTSDKERLLALIRGGQAEGHAPVAPYGEIIKRFVAWQGARNTLTIRFEDIVGARGGGSDTRRAQTLRQLFDHMELPIVESDETLSSPSQGPIKSATFRKGIVDDWKSTFDADLIDAYNETVAPYARAFGYD